MAMRARLTTLALAVGLTAGLLACGGDDGGGDETSSDTTEADGGGAREADDPTTTTLAPEEEVWNAWTTGLLAAQNAVDPNDPVLAQHTTGQTYENFVQTKRDNQAGHRRVESTIEHHRQSVVVTGDSATVRDCVVDTSNAYSTDTGQAERSPEVNSADVEATLQRVDGVWKIATITYTPQEC
jgi:hypothetical protein